MKLWIISQDVNNDYDTFDSAVVAAETEEEARNINPAGAWGDSWTGWATDPSQVTVEYLGVADRDISGVILASFNAG